MKSVVFYLLLLSFTNCLFAQNRMPVLKKLSYTDSLLSKIDAPIYYSFYNPTYMVVKTATVTVLKIDIDKKGKVTDIRFSDSADSTFLKAYANRQQWPDEKGTIEKYAKAKGYRDVSLLMNVRFEPRYPSPIKDISYDQVEAIMQFAGKEFTGNSVILPGMNIRVLAEHNM